MKLGRAVDKSADRQDRIPTNAAQSWTLSFLTGASSGRKRSGSGAMYQHSTKSKERGRQSRDLSLFSIVALTTLAFTSWTSFSASST